MGVRDLVNRSKAGDKVALYNLIAILRPIRVSMIRKFPRLDPEDLDQDLIILLIESLEDFDERKCSFQWYVREKSRYYCLDLLKKKECFSIEERDENGISFIDSLDSGLVLDDLVCDSSIRDRIFLEISKLEPRVRFVIYFHFFKDHSLKEIGVKMNTSISSVYRLKEKGVKILRKSLKDIKREDFYDN